MNRKVDHDCDFWRSFLFRVSLCISDQPVSEFHTIRELSTWHCTWHWRGYAVAWPPVSTPNPPCCRREGCKTCVQLVARLHVNIAAVARGRRMGKQWHRREEHNGAWHLSLSLHHVHRWGAKRNRVSLLCLKFVHIRTRRRSSQL
jgi:hypothetical protein